MSGVPSGTRASGGKTQAVRHATGSILIEIVVRTMAVGRTAPGRRELCETLRRRRVACHKFGAATTAHILVCGLAPELAVHTPACVVRTSLKLYVPATACSTPGPNEITIDFVCHQGLTWHITHMLWHFFLQNRKIMK